MDETTTEEPALRLAQRLRLATDRLRRVVRQPGRLDGLTRSEEMVLSRLFRHGELTTAALAQQEALRPQTMGAVVRALVEKGLVTKVPDETDRRRENVRLTDDGVAAMAQVNERRDRDLASLLERELTTDQRAQLSTVLSMLEDLGHHA
ncbi:MarR family winged helix-turn-helix transcriptional regulator [Promicromonospora citrea]|uniref:HTH marR-type domain-containing protein n=1 Tax=Promicromonospora citrea TaxID=43677 RepID=A0A8H9GMQ2_9MICO|nr:MarR family transcriptional regulator [Promicromonospora citrea]NNH51804.1 MarR family transcriptional regulator [Promicromonospora citrea]GGM36189.1 hypothetical protein GCM10010102_34390 [Promicromonospora citrea]